LLPDKKLSARVSESDIETNAIDPQAFAVEAAQPLGLRLQGARRSPFFVEVAVANSKSRWT